MGDETGMKIRELLEAAPLAKHTDLDDEGIDHVDKGRDVLMAKYKQVAGKMTDVQGQKWDDMHDKFEDLCDAGDFKKAKFVMNKLHRFLQTIK